LNDQSGSQSLTTQPPFQEVARVPSSRSGSECYSVTTTTDLTVSEDAFNGLFDFDEMTIASPEPSLSFFEEGIAGTDTPTSETDENPFFVFDENMFAFDGSVNKEVPFPSNGPFIANVDEFISIDVPMNMDVIDTNMTFPDLPEIYVSS